MKSVQLYSMLIGFLLCTACGGKNPEEQKEFLNGYWEIQRVDSPYGNDKDYSISETIYHPNKNSLAIAVRTEGYKFWVLFIDCIRGGQVTVELPSKILLFERESDDFNENNDVSGSHPRLVKEFMRLCSQHLTKDYIMTEEHKEKN